MIGLRVRDARRSCNLCGTILAPIHGQPQSGTEPESRKLLSPLREICDKLAGQSWALKDLCYSTFGLRSCAKGKGQGGKERLITSNPKAKSAKPYLEGRDIGRYAMSPTGRFISYLPEQMYSPRSPELFETPKIVSRTMLSRPKLVATYDDQGFYVEQSLACIVPHGILTSSSTPCRPSSEVHPWHLELQRRELLLRVRM